MDPHSVYLPALQAIQAALQSAGSPVIAAADGRCGAGKTTFAAYCAQHLDSCITLHMDDFFLPPEKRTPERLATPGGNVDHERAEKELFLPLTQGRKALYRPFDCAGMAFLPPRQVAVGRLFIVEGTYSLHPALAKYAQVKIFFTCSPQVQLSRLAQREPPEKLQKFQERWIPLEEAYFSAFSIQEQCDVTIDTTGLSTKEETL